MIMGGSIDGKVCRHATRVLVYPSTARARPDRPGAEEELEA